MSSKKLDGNEVKYCEFVIGNFAALLRMETKILAVVLATPALNATINYTIYSHALTLRQ